MISSFSHAPFLLIMFFFYFRYKLYVNPQKIPCELLEFSLSTRSITAFLPSSPHNTSIRRALHRLCYRRCLIAGTFPNEAITAASLSLKKSRTLSFTLPQYLLPAVFYLFFECPYHYCRKRNHHDYVLDALGGQLLFSIHCLPDAPTAHDIG